MISKILSRWTILLAIVVVTGIGIQHRLGIIAATHIVVGPATVAADSTVDRRIR